MRPARSAGVYSASGSVTRSRSAPSGPTNATAPFLGDLAGSLLARRHQPGDHEGPGQADATVPQLRLVDHHLTEVGGDAVVVEHPVERLLGLRAGAAAGRVG